MCAGSPPQKGVADMNHPSTFTGAQSFHMPMEGKGVLGLCLPDPLIRKIAGARCHGRLRHNPPRALRRLAPGLSGSMSGVSEPRPATLMAGQLDWGVLGSDPHSSTGEPWANDSFSI